VSERETERRGEYVREHVRAMQAREGREKEREMGAEGDKDCVRESAPARERGCE